MYTVERKERESKKRGKSQHRKKKSKSQVLYKCWRRGGKRGGEGSIHCNRCIFAMQTA